MFLADSHLPQLLPREAYFSREWYDREIEQIFLPSWHLVGLTSDLKKDGDYFTSTLFGRPLLVCRLEGEFRAFLNVCAHRYSLLTSRPCGNNPTLRCQYHGWEYDANGRTRKIPDAPNFRPLDRESAALKRYRVAACGQLLFVSLAEEGPSLAEHLGPNFALAEKWFPRTARAGSMRSTVAANWKVVLENALESYHIHSVHQKTLGDFPDEDSCRHELHDGSSLFESQGAAPSAMRAAFEFLHARVGLRPTRRYLHLLTYPNLTFSIHDALISLQVITPLSPSSTEIRSMAFVRQGPASAALWNVLLRMASPLEQLFWLRVVREDLAILPQVQQGIEAAEAPTGGLLSRREERCAHFQAFVARALGYCPTTAT
jgi:phenylpropionate dioxygenase-like ring-hydroxylating dioxygenase large terminal subunit